MTDRYNNSVCLCGSTRFLKQFQEANIELTKRGLSVVTISMAPPKNEQTTGEEEGLKELLDLVHLNKILMTDAVLVVGDKTAYIGFSTAREILWAEMHSKPVICQWRCHSWDNIAHEIRTGSFYTDIFPTARRVLDKNKKA